MTSFAFVLGCVPLFIATGAGSVGRQIMGTTVIGGMLAATGIAIFIIPALYVWWNAWRVWGSMNQSAAPAVPELAAVEGD